MDSMRCFLRHTMVHVAICCFFWSTISLADIPKMPLNFRVKVEAQGKVNVIAIEWEHDPTGGKATRYRISIGEGVRTSYDSSWGMVQLPFRNGEDTLKTFRYEFRHYPTGTYSFYAVEYNGEGTSPRTNILSVSLTQITLLSILSVPPVTTRAGVEYVYQPIVENIDHVTLNWMVTYPYGGDHPIWNPQTGEIRWTPNNPGAYTIKLTASQPEDPLFRVTQVWTVVVSNSGDVHCALIVGAVRDQTQQAVSRGTVDAIQLDDGLGGGTISSGEIRNGRFIILLKQPGKYVLRARGVDFLTTWYDRDSSLATANQIQVACFDSTVIDLSVTTRVRLSISGRVTNVDNNGVQASIRAHTTAGDFLDSATSKAGTYKLTVPEGHDCILLAHPYDPGYQLQFHDRVEDGTQMTTVFSAGNISDMNFVLASHSSNVNKMFGGIRNDSGQSVNGYVVAYPLLPNDQGPDLNLASTAISGSGFLLKHLFDGRTILYAVPFDKNYLPGFYKANSPVVQNWRDATVIDVLPTSYFQYIFPVLTRRTGIQGAARLQGYVSGVTKKIQTEGSQTLRGTVLPGSLVMIFDKNNRVGDYGFTNGKGFFDLREAGIGAYTVNVSKIGYEQIQTSTEFDYASKMLVEKSFELQPSQIQISVDHEESITPKKLEVSAYPNPASTHISFTIATNENQLDVKLMDCLGRILHNHSYPLNKSFSEFTIPTSGFHQGLYFLRFQGGSMERIIAIRIVR